MDPQQTLKEIRDLLSAAEGYEDETDYKPGKDEARDTLRSETLAYLTERIRALDEWLSKGGFLPAAWKR